MVTIKTKGWYPLTHVSGPFLNNELGNTYHDLYNFQIRFQKNETSWLVSITWVLFSVVMVDALLMIL